MAALTIDELLQSWGRGTIRKRFHELSMQVHPDKCSLPKADQVHISPVSRSFPDQSDQMAVPVDLCPEVRSPLLGRQSPARALHNLIACTEQLRSQALNLCMCLKIYPRNLARDCTSAQDVSLMQAFALLMRAQQMLIGHLERSEQGEVAPDEVPADGSGPDTIPEQHLFKLFQVGNLPESLTFIVVYNEAAGAG